MSSISKAHLSTREIQKTLQTFLPASTRAENYPELTLKGAGRFPDALGELCDFFHEKPVLTPFQTFNTEFEIAKRLRERFLFYKTDKAGHNYHEIYGEILSKLGVYEPLHILEVGLGTNDTSRVSHMSPKYNPGASLRAFRDVAPNSLIFGADIDQTILFSEERIETAWADQMEPESFIEMNRQFGNIHYDLVIDDGLHAVTSNLNTLIFALTVLRKGGWVVIEDIWTGQICWDTVYQLIPPEKFNRYLFTFNTSKRVFAVEKRR